MNGLVAVATADLIESNPKPETRRAETQPDLQHRGLAAPGPSGTRDEGGCC